MAIIAINETGDARLADGRTLRLANVDWPLRSAAADRQRLATRIRDMMSSGVVLAEIVGLQDRWSRWPANLFIASSAQAPPLWLQGEVLEAGLAMAWPSNIPDSCWPAARNAEQKARAAKVGLWSRTALPGIEPNDGHPTTRRRVYEGFVTSVRRGRSVTFVNFAGARDLTPSLMMPHALVNEFRKLGRDPATFVGKRLRVRAEVEPGSRPRLSVAGPHMVEIVE